MPTPSDTVVKEVVRVDSVLVAVDIERGCIKTRYIEP